MSDDTDVLVQNVIAAWLNAGPTAKAHRQMQNKLWHEWPALARAIEELIEARGR